MKETRIRIGRLWKEGKWRQSDMGAKAFYEENKAEIDGEPEAEDIQDNSKVNKTKRK